jgi:hypothetical protein
MQSPAPAMSAFLGRANRAAQDRGMPVRRASVVVR